jgi:hypothetical protein
MILRLLCIWLVFYSLLSSLMHGTMNLKFKQMCVPEPKALQLGYPLPSAIKQDTGSFKHFLVYILCLRLLKTKYNNSCLLANLMRQTDFNHAF